MAQAAHPLRAGARDPRIAARLRELRKATGMTASAAAAKAGWSETKISRVERGIGSVTTDDLNHLLGLYGATPDDIAALTYLAGRVADRGIKGRPRPDTVEVWRAEAVAAWCWGPSLIPPPLRTAGYARAVAAASADVMGWVPSQVRAAGDGVGRWLDRITARREPLRIAAVIDATALRRRFGSCGADKMGEQVRHLAWLSGRPNVDLKVLPLDAAAPAGLAAFTVLEFDDDELPLADVALPDDLGFGEPLTAERATWRCRQQFARLAAAAELPGPAIAAASAHWAAAP